MRGDRVLFVMSLPDGGVAHVATWFLRRGRRSVVEATATIVPREGAPLHGTVHYPGWALKSWQPDEKTVALGFGPSEIVTEPAINIVDLRLSAKGLGFRVRFVGSADRMASDAPIGGGSTPHVAMFGTAQGLCGVHGQQSPIDGRASWETCTLDTDALGPPGFSRAWAFQDEIAFVVPTPEPAVGGPIDFDGPLRKELFNRMVPRTVTGSLPGQLELTIGPRSWQVVTEDLLDLPLIGALPFSGGLERWWLRRRERPWRWRLRALRLPGGPRVGLHEEWSLDDGRPVGTPPR